MFKIDNDFHKRILNARTSRMMTQTELANCVNVTQRQIAAYEAGKAKPREKVLLNLAFSLKVNPEWLASGVKSEDSKPWTDITPSLEVQHIPLFSFSDLEKLEVFNIDPMHCFMHPCPVKTEQNTYAFYLDGDAMTLENKLGFPDGSIVTVQKTYNFTNGSFYLIRVGEILTFKQVFKDELKTTFKSLNKNYADSVYKNDEYKILAKAVYVEINLDK